MILTRLQVDGLRGASGGAFEGAAGLCSLPSGPRGVALADALTLLAGALDVRRVPGVLCALGIVRPSDALEVLDEGGVPTQASFASGDGVRPLLHPEGERGVRISADFALDPPLFGDLRRQAARDPRLVTALGQQATATLRAGWLFSADLSVGSPAVFELRIGEVAFPTQGKERAPWVAPLLREIAGRIGRVPWWQPVPELHADLFAASVSPDPELRRRWRGAARSLEGAPFGLGHLRMARLHDAHEPVFGDDLLPSRQFGPSAVGALRLARSVWLDAPDVLVVEAPSAAARDLDALGAWLAERCEGDDATLEQVLLVHGGGA